MTSARFDKAMSFPDMDPMALLHISQLLELEAFGTHRVRNGDEILHIRIERWPDDEIYVRLLNHRELREYYADRTRQLHRARRLKQQAHYLAQAGRPVDAREMSQRAMILETLWG